MTPGELRIKDLTNLDSPHSSDRSILRQWTLTGQATMIPDVLKYASG